MNGRRLKRRPIIRRNFCLMSNRRGPPQGTKRVRLNTEVRHDGVVGLGYGDSTVDSVLYSWRNTQTKKMKQTIQNYF